MPIDINDRSYYGTHFYGKWMRSLADAEIVAKVGDQVVVPYCTTLRVATVVSLGSKMVRHVKWGPKMRVIRYKIRLHQQTGYGGMQLSDPGKIVRGWRDETEVFVP